MTSDAPSLACTAEVSDPLAQAAPQQRILGWVLGGMGALFTLMALGLLGLDLGRLTSGVQVAAPGLFLVPSALGPPLLIAARHAVRGATAAVQAADGRDVVLHGEAALRHAAALYVWLATSALLTPLAGLLLCLWPSLSSAWGG